MGEPAALVGRNPELAVWSEVLGSLRTGPLGCVLYGAAGIGKTTVLNAALDAARAAGCHVLAAGPAESETALAYAGLAELLAGAGRPVVTDLAAPQRGSIEAALHGGEPLPAALAHRAIRVAVLEIVRRLAAGSPVVIGIDDTQWMDPASAKVVEYVLRKLDREPVCLLVALRSDHDELLPFGMDQAFDVERLVRIGLPGLSLGALQRVLATRAGLVVPRTEFRRIAAVSAGNPLLALEIARTRELNGQSATTRDVEVLVAKRLSGLPIATREALAVVAALARPTADLVRIALEGQGSGIEHAEAEGLLRIEAGRVRFTHPVYASVVSGELSTPDRHVLHARLADVVEDVEERARHLAVATSERDLRLAEKLAAAARQAERRGAPEAAAELWELAGLRTPEDQAGLRFGRIARAGTSIAHTGEFARARGLLSTAVRRLPSGSIRAAARLALADVSFGQGKSREAVSLCRRALLEAGDERGLRIEGGIRAAWYGAHDVREQLESVQHAAGLLDDDDLRSRPELYACVELLVARCRFYSGYGLDRRRIGQAHELLRADGLGWPAPWARTVWRSLVMHWDLPAARSAAVAELELAGLVGDESGQSAVSAQLAEIDYWLGDWGTARREAQGVLRTAAGRPGTALYVLGLVDAHRGELDAAHEVAERGLESASAVDDLWISAAYLGLLGFVELSRQDHAGAAEYFELAEHLVDGIGLAEPAWHRFHGDQVEAVLELGDLDRAAVLVNRLVRRARVAPYGWLRATTYRSQGLLRFAAGRPGPAREAFDSALAVLDGLAMPFEQARTQLALGRLLRRHGDQAEADQMLATARAGFDRVGAPVWSALAKDA